MLRKSLRALLRHWWMKTILLYSGQYKFRSVRKIRTGQYLLYELEKVPTCTLWKIRFSPLLGEFINMETFVLIRAKNLKSKYLSKRKLSEHDPPLYAFMQCFGETFLLNSLSIKFVSIFVNLSIFPYAYISKNLKPICLSNKK